MNEHDVLQLLTEQFHTCATVRKPRSNAGEWYQIVLPFWHGDGDGYCIYVSQKADGSLLLTDSGDAFLYLENYGEHDPIHTEGIPEKIARICREYSCMKSSVSFVDGEVQATCAPDFLLKCVLNIAIIIAKIEELELPEE